MGPCNSKQNEEQNKQKKEEQDQQNSRPKPQPKPKPASEKRAEKKQQQSQQQKEQPKKAKEQVEEKEAPPKKENKETAKKQENLEAPKAKNAEVTRSEQIEEEENDKVNLIQKRKNDPKDNIDFTSAGMVQEKYGKINDDYNLLDPPLGTGAFGEVRKGVHKGTGMNRAVKIIDKSKASEEEIKQLINEVEIMKKLDHPHIVKVYEYYQDEKFFYIVSEMCSGGELFDRIQDEGCYDEKKACETIQTCLQAINYCHKNGIVHRDLKPENLLYDVKGEEGILKVIDFGTSLTFDKESDGNMNQVLGTPYYIAPEVLRKKYTEKCDVWSLGVILYILLCGYPPFYGKTDKTIMKRVLKGKYAFEGYEWEIISQDAKDLIKKMLVVNPDDRLSAEQCLQDAWITNQAALKPLDEDKLKALLMNMKGFKAQQKLQEAIYMFFVTFMATREEKNELLATFKALDADNDGKVTEKELLVGYLKFLPEDEAQKTVKQVMDAIDSNHSGAIDYTEFVMATLNRENMLSPQRMEKVFQAFDTDGSGNLDIQEFKEIFGGNKIDDEIWKQIISEADADNSGEISYAEFKNTMIKLIN